MTIETLHKKFLECDKVSTDTRKITDNCIFFALKGEHFNGNGFAEEALKKGAKYAVIDERKYLSNTSCILVDDVLNTGRTLAYALKPFLSTEIKKLQTAVVVDRNHKTFPISADYVGYALSTTIQEHVKVFITEED